LETFVFVGLAPRTWIDDVTVPLMTEFPRAAAAATISIGSGIVVW
jgi:hypothetical protein